MADMTDPFREIFLAGVGALALGAEKSKEVVDQLIARGQITVDQGKDIAADLQHQAHEGTSQVRDDVIKAYLSSLSKDERDAFAARVADMASDIDGADELQSEEATEVSADEKATE